MKILIKTGSRNGNLLMVVTFEQATNFDAAKLEWVPTVKETELIHNTLRAILNWKGQETKL